MHANHLIRIWITAAVLLSCALISLYITEKRIESSLQRDLVFADKTGNIQDIARVDIETTHKKITLQKDEDLWRVTEADNYYASFSKIQMLLENIKEARLGKEISLLSEEIIWKKIYLYNNQDKQQAAVMIGKSPSQNTYYARRINDSEIYLSTWKMNLSDSLYSWTKQPLLDLKSKDIQRIESEDGAISRRDEGALFYDEQNHRLHKQQDYLKIFAILNDLHYENVRASQNFSPENYPYRHTINITTFSGLITTITIYTNKTEYWLQVKLSANRLPQREVNHYISQNSILYEDWWFQVADEEGVALFNLDF